MLDLEVRFMRSSGQMLLGRNDLSPSLGGSQGKLSVEGCKSLQRGRPITLTPPCRAPTQLLHQVPQRHSILQNTMGQA